MTTAQIRKTLTDAKVLTLHTAARIEISKGEVEVAAGLNGSEALAKRVSRCLQWGGFKTGYGAWIYKENYKGRGDFMDKGSDHHYY